MFVVIDWIDWSWKWTQIKLLTEKLTLMWKKVKVLDYPRYWEPSAFAVEKYLNWEYWNNVSAKLWSVFYAIDRYDSSFDIKDSLDKYDYILSNRYVSASMIHQAWKIEDEKEVIEVGTCPECGNKIIEKKTRKGKIFYGCSNYPKCKYASWDKPSLTKED